MKSQYKDFQQFMVVKLIRLQRYRHEDGGFVMVVVIAMILILTSLLGVYNLFGKTETSSTKASVSSNTGFYAAEAGLNLRAKQIQDTFVGFNLPQGDSPESWQNCADTNLTNNGSGDFACIAQTFNNQNLLTYVVDQTPTNPETILIPTGEPFAGLTAQEYRYDITSLALGSQNLPSAILGMRFKSRLVPMFQFVAFYNDDLEFAVPPTITLNGAIHSNSNLYLDASATLTINGQVSAVGSLYRGSKIDNSCNGTVRIFDQSILRSLFCSGSARTTYNQSGVSAWNNMIRLGVPQLTIPSADTLDPISGKLYWDKADLRVVLKLNSRGNPNSIEVRNQDSSVNTAATYDLLNSCPTASTTLQNEPDGTSNYGRTDTVLRVDSVIGFAVGDLVTVGADYDSNVITVINTSTREITLKRQLGHTSYQPSVIASTGAIVRKAVVSTSDTFYNYREKNGGSGPNAGRFIRMLNVDIQGLLDCVHSRNLMGKTLNENSDGGLVWFLTVEGPNSNTNVTQGGIANNYGVRVYKGKYLYSKLSGAPAIQGLSIVSDQAAYIQGDYNLKDDPTTIIDEGDDLTTLTIRERWRPAAILADTINVLSNAWSMDDSDSRQYSGDVPNPSPSSGSTISGGTTTVVSRTASETKINAAFLAGNDISGGANGAAGQGRGWSSSGGGLNNYPRFHEDWTGINFFYKGSFVTLNQPRRVNGPWCGSQSINSSCNIYNPPNRFWDYDTNFNNAANLPPLTPRFVYLRQEVFSRDFER